MSATSDQLFAALEATWPPLSSRRVGPFRLRVGGGGGKRVSAAVLEGAHSDDALDAVETELGAAPLFQLRDSQSDFDAVLAARGYDVVDPTLVYSAPITLIAEAPRPVSLLAAWPPLAMQRQVWLDGGVGPERVAVMERACEPKNGFIARFQNRVAGAGFVAIHDGIAVLHALQVEEDFRRLGVARYMVRGIAHWAMQNGAKTYALAVTKANFNARGLYSQLGMTEVEAYHYRQKKSSP
ncbi:GNAT family N-acetyltransferase [Pararhodobacter sp.]|uniref:GNAT family N-acetyltransferase n=1 Tax=Pararhodobacter sp. TaxID=2127056 RepID=UPI002AFEE4B5|nr:GNAT family N-acetyltransferase [Pararhodobacter sp.]